MSGTSAEQDQTVNDYLAACAKSSKVWSECSFEVTTMGLYDEFDPHGNHSSCPPSSSTEAETEVKTTSVINWLTAHPETHHMTESAGILTALRALYPCQ
jgi:hypothetical protein